MKMSRPKARSVLQKKRAAEDNVEDKKIPKPKRIKKSVSSIQQRDEVQAIASPVPVPAEAMEVEEAKPALVHPPGVVYTFGVNMCGQLGIPAENEQRKFPALIETFHSQGINAVSVAAGGMHSLVLTDDGKVYSFGCNDEGALGRPTDGEEEDEQSSCPKQVELKGKAISITAGSSHSAALMEDGQVFCWGIFRDGNGHYGLVPGDGDFPDRSLFHPVPVQLALEFGTKIRSIASGNDHMALLTDEGKVLTFGSCIEVLGRPLPNVTTRTRHTAAVSEKTFNLTPTVVSFSGKRKFRNIWAGSSSTLCQEDTPTGSIWAFGMNSMKQLGKGGKSTEQMIPTPFRATTLTKKHFIQISIGEFHCLGLTEDGKVFSWGKPHDGQLGLGDETPDAPTWTPQHVTSLKEKVVRVACGHSVSYALTASSKLFSWGFAVNWQLGNGQGDDVDAKVPTPVLTKRKGEPAQVIREVSASAQHVMLIGEYGLGMDMDL